MKKIVISISIIGGLADSRGSAPALDESWTKTIAQVMCAIDTESYYPLEKNRAMIKALDAYVREADPHSKFYSPAEYKELLESTTGIFFGIGIEFSDKKIEGMLHIHNVKQKSPAEKAGLKSGDNISEINGIAVASLTMQQALNKIKGNKRYEQVRLLIKRGKKPIPITVRRDIIQEDTCCCYYLPSYQTVFCKIALFTQEVASQLQHLLDGALLKKPKAIIIDVRDNGGGILKSAIKCAALFLPKGSLVIMTKDRSGKVIDRLFTLHEPRIKNLPIIILVNKNTASSAEILAQSLRLHAKKNQKPLSQHVYVMGTQTYGKGSIQEIKQLSNNCALKLTTAHYYFCDNSTLHEKGIVPDISVKASHTAQPQDKNIKQGNDAETYSESELLKDTYIYAACSFIKLLETNSPAKIDTHKKQWS